jgi:hypothetical protein
MPSPHTVVAVIEGASHRREHRVELDARIAVCDQSLYVTRVIRLEPAAMELDVLFRHALRLI